jgi:mono/diheme cytochrome c family protein
MTLFRDAGCVACHKIGAEGGAVGPDLTHIGARVNANYIRESILDPGAKIARGYEPMAGVMPKTFGEQMTAAQMEALVRFLAARR